VSHKAKNNHRDQWFDNENKEGENNNHRNQFCCACEIYLRAEQDEIHDDKEISE